MKGKRKRHSAQFKAKIGLEGLKGRKTVQQIAKENQIHPTQVSQWKQEIAKRLPEVFESPSQGGLHERRGLPERLRGFEIHRPFGELLEPAPDRRRWP